ncbi:hydrolase [Streptomyces phage Wakanda]|uniref:Hydrolase n=2 Tax=Wakandavirus TaxID=3044854 RepID=A0A6G8R3H3_9CAUD|nr:hydrolase [Streptomyces phage Wakanda]YP_010652500.1 hydrolase [Streptomyces phage Muntaha]QIN94178.1 hydrolase [Streptomyces phage Wakanda]QIN94744.1 hydrolase [Streptomyces phage Muntaha]
MRKVISAAVLAAAFTLAMPANAEAATSLRVKALNVAAAQKNDPYQWGAEGPSRFDCSGLTYYSYKQSGKTLPRVAQSQYNSSKKVSPSSRTKGDLVFIGTSSSRIYHVGIYAGFWDGKGWMWNANTGSYRGRKVVLAPIREYTAGSPRAYYGRY